MTCSTKNSRSKTQLQGAAPDLVIKGGTVISMVEGQEPVLEASVYVVDGRIIDIRKRTSTIFTLKTI